MEMGRFQKSSLLLFCLKSHDMTSFEKIFLYNFLITDILMIQINSLKKIKQINVKFLSK